MSANNIVELFEKLGILNQIIEEAGDTFFFYDKEQLADYLTYVSQEDVLQVLLGKSHPITKKHNADINELIKK